VQSLSIHNGDYDDLDSVLTKAMPVQVSAAVLGSQCSSLLKLDFTTSAGGLAGNECVALAVLTRLTCLQVR